MKAINYTIFNKKTMLSRLMHSLPQATVRVIFHLANEIAWYKKILNYIYIVIDLHSYHHLQDWVHQLHTQCRIWSPTCPWNPQLVPLCWCLRGNSRPFSVQSLAGHLHPVSPRMRRRTTFADSSSCSAPLSPSPAVSAWPLYTPYRFEQTPEWSLD